MRYIKLFEGYLKDTSDEVKVRSHLQDIFVELKDIGFKIKIHTDTDTDDSVVYVSIELTKEDFIYGDIKEYILMAIDYMKTKFKLEVHYTNERKVIVHRSKTYISKNDEPKDTDEICSVSILIYKN